MNEKTTGLTEFCQILKDTALESAPSLLSLGEMVDALGEEFGLKGIETLGEALETFARMTLQSADMARENGIALVDKNGGRGIRDQILVVKAFKRIREAAILQS